METKKTCSKCKIEKFHIEFNKHKLTKDKCSAYCKKCTNEYSVNHYKNNKQLYFDKSKKHKKTFKGKVTAIYAAMRQRILGNTGTTAHKYIGLPICNKKEFYDWSLNDPIYKELHRKWVESNFDETYKPSIDRIIPEKGYVLSNIRWMSWEDNHKKDNVDLTKYELNDDGTLPF